MKNLKNRSLALLIIAILAISTGTLLVNTTSAHTPPQTIQMYAFINVGPNPAGLGQTVTVGFWLNEPPMTANGPYGDRFGPFTVNVVKPDGTNETLGPFISDDTGGTATRYTPTQLGEYQFQMFYPGQKLTGSSNNPSASGTSGISNPSWVNDTMLPAVSPVATLTVQQEPVASIPNTALPSQYWQTPIKAEMVLHVGHWMQFLNCKVEEVSDEGDWRKPALTLTLEKELIYRPGDKAVLVYLEGGKLRVAGTVELQ